MKFCQECNNMLYINVDDDKSLLYYCKSCGHKEATKDKHSICIIDDVKIDDSIKYAQYINPYLKHDPCLPRVKNIVCPNPKCTRPEGQENEVIYIKYDNVNMKFLYTCVYCNNFWTKN